MSRQETGLVEGANVFRDAVAHGVLVKKGVQMMVNGKLQTFGPGDVMQPGSADLMDGAAFVQQVANRCRSAGGQVHGSSWFGVYTNKKALDAATHDLRAKLATGRQSAATRLVEAELARMKAQGRTINKSLIDRVVGHTIGSFDDSIKDAIRADLYNDFEVQAEKK